MFQHLLITGLVLGAFYALVAVGYTVIYGTVRLLNFAHGDMYMQPTAARALAQGIKRKGEHADERDKYEKLTDREKDVLRYVASGFSAPEIGEKLFISPKTVDTYKQRIQEKLGLAHRSEYVQLALKLGLLVET